MESSQPPSIYPPGLAFDPLGGSIVRPPNNIPYILAILGMMGLGIAGSVTVIIAKVMEPLLVTGAIFAFITPTTASMLAFMKAQETHLSVNSRLDEFMRNASFAARAQGRQEGRAEGQQVANARTDTLAEQAKNTSS